jgi:hypothetical protein
MPEVLKSEPITGRHADVLACANLCFEAAMRLIRPGKLISSVAEPLDVIAQAYDCTLVEGVMTHNMKQFVIDGNKCILNRPTSDEKVEDAEFMENEVYAIDIVVSSGAATQTIFFLLFTPSSLLCMSCSVVECNALAFTCVESRIRSHLQLQTSVCSFGMPSYAKY